MFIEKRKLIYWALVLFFLWSCNKKKEDPKIYTVTGRLVHNCDSNSPVANQQLVMYSPPSGYTHTSKIDKVTTTDENGNFVFGYTKVNGVGSNTTLIISGVLYDIPALQCISLGEISMQHNVKAQLKITVANPYTENDTLYVLDYFSNNPLNYKLVTAGPFTDTLFEPQVINNNGELFYENGKFNSRAAGGMYIQSNGVQIKNFYKKESVENCNATPYVLEVVID